MSITSGVQLAPLSVDINTNLANFRRGMAEATQIGVSEATNLSTKLTKAIKVGDSISGVGDSLTKHISLPLAGIAVAAGKIGMDFESQMSRVKAISGATGDDFKKLEDQAISLGASTAFSASEAAEGMENLASAGFNTNEIMEAMPGMMDLAASSGEDLASSADIAASTLRGFGLEASQAGHVADVLAKNASATNAAVSDTGEAMKYIAPVAKAMGLSLEETTSAIGIMANAGIKGSEAGTALRQSLVRLASPSQEAADKMQAIGFNAFDAQGKLLPLNQIIGNLQNSTKNLTDEQKQNAIATIFGAESLSGMLTLMDAGPGQINELTDSLKNSDGAAKEMATTMQDNAKSSVEQMVGSLETAAIKIEKSVAPTITKIAGYVGDLADKFANLSEDQQENILKWGAIAIAAGPVLKVFGGGITTVAKLGKGIIDISTALKAAQVATTATTVATEGLAGASTVAAGTAGVGGLSALAGGLGTIAVAAAPVALAVAAVGATVYACYENSEYMNSSLLTTTEQLSPLQKLFNDLDGGVLKSREEMERLGLINHEWSNNVAPEVAESVDKAAKSWENLNFEIDNNKISDAVTPEDATNIKNQTAQLCNDVINEIKAKQSESQKALSEFFNVDNSMDTYETTVLSFFGNTAAKQTAIVQENQDKINAIYQKAADEHRKITEAERVDITEAEKKINQAKIDALSTSQEEYQELQANFNVKMRNLDLAGASELMQQKAQTRDDDLAKTNEYYDTKIEMLQSNLNNMNEDQRVAAQNEINKLQQEKTEKVKVINDTYNGYLKTLEERYPEIYNKIDLEEGKILTKEEQDSRIRVANSISMFDNIGSITQSGMQRLYNTQTKSYEDVYVMVDDKTGKIVGTWNRTKDQISGNSDEIKAKLGEVAAEHNNLSASQQRDMESMIISNSNYTASTKYNALKVAQALQGTGSEVNGLYTEVVNVNGQPIQVQVNKDGTIANLNEIDAKLNQTARDRHLTIWATYVDTNGNAFTASARYSDGRGGYYANGKDYIPFDGYMARLHKGERVLTSEENEKYTEAEFSNTNNKSEKPIILYANLVVDGKEFTQTVVAPNQRVLSDYYKGR